MLDFRKYSKHKQPKKKQFFPRNIFWRTFKSRNLCECICVCVCVCVRERERERERESEQETEKDSGEMKKEKIVHNFP